MKQFLIACTVASALSNLRPGAEWVMQNDDFTTLTWLDKTQTAPTEKEVQEALSSCQQQETTKQQEMIQTKSTLESKTSTTDQKVDALIKYLGI